MKSRRVVCWFSCGATSAVATKIALKKFHGHEIVIVYCDTGSEHEDNDRFMAECAQWFNQEIKVIRSEKYRDIWQVFKDTRWLVGPSGARCTTELKKIPRKRFQLADDIQIFGMDATETKRIQRFKQNEFEVDSRFPLLEAGITKKDCIKHLQKAGIRIPTMYLLGYPNNNCVGCVKGQAGYWNKIRQDFPDVFERMAKVERELDVAINKSYAGDGKRKRVFLDEMSPLFGKELKPVVESCSFMCDEMEVIE